MKIVFVFIAGVLLLLPSEAYAFSCANPSKIHLFELRRLAERAELFHFLFLISGSIVMSLYLICRYLKPISAKYHRTFLAVSLLCPLAFSFRFKVGKVCGDWSELYYAPEIFLLWLLYCLIVFGIYSLIMRIKENERKDAIKFAYLLLISVTLFFCYRIHAFEFIWERISKLIH